MLKLDRRGTLDESCFPNALEQLLYIFADHFEESDDSPEHWTSKWENFFDHEKIDLDIDFKDCDKKRDWVEGVVKKITDRHQFVSTLIAKNNTNA